MPGYEMPSIEEPTDEAPAFTHTRPIDNRTGEQVEAEWRQHRDDVEMVGKFKTADGKTDFQKAVEEYPTDVPESFLTKEERDKRYGVHLLTKHEIEREKELN